MFTKKENWWRVEHIKAHRPRKRSNKCGSSRNLSLKGNEKADESAKDGAMMDGGVMARVRASTVQQGRREVYAALHHAASFHCLVEELKPKTK